MTKEAVPPSLLLVWETFTLDLIERIEDFPKRARPTLAYRLENTALDIQQALLEAHYTKEPLPFLEAINLRLDLLRALLRLSFRRRFLTEKSLEILSDQINEVGRRIGGWRKASHA